MLARRKTSVNSSVVAPLRDLMDWNGAKADHVIASTTRRRGNGGQSDISYLVRKSHAHLYMKNGPLVSRDCTFRIGSSPFLATLSTDRLKRQYRWIEARNRLRMSL